MKKNRKIFILKKRLTIIIKKHEQIKFKLKKNKFLLKLQNLKFFY